MQGHHKYLMRRAILAAQLSLLCQNLNVQRTREHLSVLVLGSSIAFPTTVWMPSPPRPSRISLKRDVYIKEVGRSSDQSKECSSMTLDLHTETCSRVTIHLRSLPRVTLSSTSHYPPRTIVKPHHPQSLLLSPPPSSAFGAGWRGASGLLC